jgi:hypothetical protein
MKQLILMMTVLIGFTFNANAAAPMAEIIISGTASNEKALVKLFNKEAKIKNSPINAYLAALKADPDNQDYDIEGTITDMDIVRLDSGATAGNFEINYLILIRAGYKSNIFQVGYLKARMWGSIEEDSKTKLTITEPAKVEIE